MRLKVFEDEVALVETEEGKCYITNKLSGHTFRLIAVYDGFFQLQMCVTGRRLKTFKEHLAEAELSMREPK